MNFKTRLSKIEKVFKPIDPNKILIIGWTDADSGPITPEELEEAKRKGIPIIFRGEAKEYGC